MRMSTLGVHGGRENLGQAHVPPIDLSTTYKTPDLEQATASIDAMAEGRGPAGGSIYQRLHNPTVARFEEAMAGLEGAEEAVAYGSGMAAVTDAASAVGKRAAKRAARAEAVTVAAFVVGLRVAAPAKGVTTSGVAKG